MKFISLMVTLVSARVSLNSKFAMRKYSQLMSVFKHHDHAFDEQKYWHYGCNCQILSEYICMGLLFWHDLYHFNYT